MVSLGDLGDVVFDSGANAVSADGGSVVGFGYTEEESYQAMIWDAANGMRSVQDILINEKGLSEELAGWKLDTATDMSADGLTIIGEGINPAGNREVWIAHIGPGTLPTPSPLITHVPMPVFALGILAAAFGVVGSYRRMET